jgi:hypothetical protein
VQPHGGFKLELTRRHSLRRTDGTGSVTLQVDEPGTSRSPPWLARRRTSTLAVMANSQPASQDRTTAGRLTGWFAAATAVVLCAAAVAVISGGRRGQPSSPRPSAV